MRDPLHEMSLFCAGQFGCYGGHQVVGGRNHTTDHEESMLASDLEKEAKA